MITGCHDEEPLLARREPGGEPVGQVLMEWVLKPIKPNNESPYPVGRGFASGNDLVVI